MLCEGVFLIAPPDSLVCWNILACWCVAARRSAQVVPRCTAEGFVLSLHSILTVTSSLFSTSSSGSVLQFLLMHTCAHTDLDHLTLVAMTAALKAAPRCQCVSLTSPAGTPTPAHPCSPFVCMCVMMINTFVLKVNRELLCKCLCLCVCVFGVSVSMCSPPCGCASAFLPICVHQ